MKVGGRPLARAGLALLGAVLVAAAGCRPVHVPRMYRVTIHGFRFDPARVSAQPGDTVVWTNGDALPHTATRDGGGWSSGAIAAGAEWRMPVTTASAGPYHCAFHPTMTAELVAAK
ncbi:MAG: copper-binding protein [Gemmatimonadetes bacterium]|nr:copper-binding protein [Gemmatimonadota bacterium]